MAELLQAPLPRAVSVVIPTFRRPHLLADVVHPHLTDPAVMEVIIVDDGSEDETAAVCAELASRSPKVRVLCQENAGAADARASGAATARGDVLLFLDDDVVAANGIAGRHLSWHQAAPSPLVVVGYMPPLIAGRRVAGQFPVHLYRRSYERMCRRYELDPSTILLNLWGGHLSVRRELYRRARRVEPQVYHEDRLLGWSLLEAGCSGAFDRSLISEHHYSRSPEQFFGDCRRSGRTQRVLASLAPPEARVGVDSDLGVLGRLVLRVLAAYPHVTIAILGRGVRRAGRARQWSLETNLARVVAALEAEAAYRDSSCH